MSIVESAVLGAIQGLSEFLPISSSGHLILARHFFGWDSLMMTSSQLAGAAATTGTNTALLAERLDKAFDLSLHLGTAVAVVSYFAKDLVRVFGSLLRRNDARSAERRLAIGIVLGSIPAVLVGVLLEEQIDAIFRREKSLIALFLIVFGLLMWMAERYGKQTRREESVSIGDALAVGIAQAMALCPGVSRSGITITAAMTLGLTREAAARFSFWLMSPIVLGAAVYKLLDLRHLPDPVLRSILPAMAAGAITSAVVGALSIGFLLRFLRTNSVLAFTVYRVALGLAVLATLWFRR